MNENIGVRPMANAGSPKLHSVHEIMTGVEAIMLRLSGGRAVDSALANAIAGKIHLAVNDPAHPMEALAGNPAFETLVSEAAPSLAKIGDDPAARLAAARAEVERYNPSGGPLSPATMAALGLGPFGAMGGAPSGRTGESSSSGSSQPSGGTTYAGLNTRWDPSSGGAGLNQHNFVSSPFYGLHLDLATTKTLFSQGFNAPQIERAAKDAQALRLAPTAAAIDTAHLRRAEGKRTDQHIRTLSQYGHDVEDIERARREEEGKPDSPEKTERLRQLDERRKAIESGADRYQQNKVQTPEGRERFRHLREMIRDQAKLRAEIGDPKARAVDDAKLDAVRGENKRNKSAANEKAERLSAGSRMSDVAVAGELASSFGMATPGEKSQTAAAAPGRSDKPNLKTGDGENKGPEAGPPPPANRATAAKANKSGPAPA